MLSEVKVWTKSSHPDIIINSLIQRFLLAYNPYCATHISLMLALHSSNSVKYYEYMSELWSDFDGTAVGIKGKTDPRNWAKYPLPILPGYTNFLDGVRSSGVDIAGVVSRRPDIYPRRYVTQRSITRLGLQGYFGDGEVILAGSERQKAQHVVDRVGEARVGLIDDKPHRVGVELVHALSETAITGSLTLGVVKHDKSIGYVQRLREVVDGIDGVEVDTALDGRFDIAVGDATLRVVEMMPYSVEAGQHFAEKI